MTSTSASMDPQRLATALERTKVEARESARSLRIVQRKLDSAAEEAEARIKSEKEKLVQLHRAELAEVKSKFEREHVALKEANEAKRARADNLDDDDEDEEMAEQLEETTFLLTQARSENARLQQEAEKVQMAHHACMEQRDEELGKLSAEQARTKRLEDSLRKVQEQASEDKRSATSKVTAAREELGKEREKRLQLRDERDALQKELTSAEAASASQLRKANEEIVRLQEAMLAPDPNSAPSSSAEITRLRTELRSALAKVTALKPLEAELAKSRRRLASANSQIRKQEQTIRSLESRLAEAERELGVKSNEIVLLRSTAMAEAKAEAASVVCALREELMLARNELEMAHVQVEGYEKEVANLKGQLDFAQDIAHAKSKESSQLRTDVEILQAQVATHTTKMANVVELSARHSALAKKHAALEEQAAEEIEQAKEALEEQKKQVEDWQNRALALEAKMQDVQFPKIGLGPNGKGQEATLESVVVNELRRTVEELRSRLDEEKENLIAALDHQAEQTKEATAEHEALRETCAKLETESKQAELQRKASSALVSVLRTKLSESEANVAKLGRTLAACKELLSRYSAEREQTRAKALALETQLHDVQRERDSIAEALQSATRQDGLSGEEEAGLK